MKWRVLEGNCVDVMRDMSPASVDAVICDPPYELDFMGKSWDGSGVAFQPSTWAEAHRVLKPGGHLLAFGGTRTYHRLTSAVEDAGFEIRDCVAWMYASGFPKSRNLGTGWGTALKPAFEPIVIARKPLVGSVALNVERFGTGAINVEACRIPSAEKLSRPPAGDAFAEWAVNNGGQQNHHRLGKRRPAKVEPSGRWPANVVLDEGAAADLDAQARSAARFFYCAKPTQDERRAGLPEPNRHPTVKPISLMRWLCRLVTPLGGIVLDPFTGSGSTGCAAVLEGFDFIGIEREPDYAALARNRISHWATQPAQLDLGEAA